MSQPVPPTNQPPDTGGSPSTNATNQHFVAQHPDENSLKSAPADCRADSTFELEIQNQAQSGNPDQTTDADLVGLMESRDWFQSDQASERTYVAGRSPAGKAHDPVSERTRAILSELNLYATPGDRFDLQEQIAEGGMGIVWRAWDKLVGRPVAVKLLKEDFIGTDLLVRRFLAEARISGLLEHQGTIPVHAIGLLNDRQPFIAMRLIEGRSLQSLLDGRSCGSQDQMRFLKIFERICHAMAYAHDHHIIHRDLKPDNIIVGDYGIVKVTDWGLAKRLNYPGDLRYDFGRDPAEIPDSHSNPESDAQIGMLSGAETSWGTVFGTLAYLPPEQAQGKTDQVDKRADVFSLAAILCEILTGSPPYCGNEPAELYRRAARADLSDAFERLNRCSADNGLIQLAIKCLSPEPTDRCRNAGELAGRLTECLEADIRRSERDLVRFFDLSLDLFCIAGLNGYMRRVNVNFTRILGYTETTLLTLPFMHYVHPDDHQPTEQAMRTLGEGRPVVRFCNRYRHQDGHYILLEWTARSVPEEGLIYAAARKIETAEDAVFCS